MSSPVHVVTWTLGYENGLVGIYTRRQAALNALAGFVHQLEDNGGTIEIHELVDSYRWERGNDDFEDYQSVVIFWDQEVQS